MALFRITVTRRKNTAGMLIEPGMSVQSLRLLTILSQTSKSAKK